VCEQVLKMVSPEIVVVDVRVPCIPAAILANHDSACNGMAWAPHSSCHICTAGDDHKAVIWDIGMIPRVSAQVRHAGLLCRPS
jgi:WD repeat-containing protein 68